MVKPIVLIIDQEAKTDLINLTDKSTIKIFGKSITQFQLEYFQNLGITDIYIVTNRSEVLSRDVELYPKMNINFIDYEHFLKRFTIDTTLLVTFNNAYIPQNAIELLLNTHLKSSEKITILTAPVENVRNKISIRLNVENYVESVEKVEFLSSGYVFTGFLIIEPEVFKKINREFLPEIDKFLMKCIDERLKICTCLWSGIWGFIESSWEFLEFTKEFTKTLDKTYISPNAKISPKAVIEGPVYIDDYAIIDHDSIIRGPVYIGKNVYIGNNALIRNCTVIESNCTIGSNVEVSESIIQPGTTIGRNAYIGNSVIGTNVIIEPGVTTLTVVRIEKGKYIKKGSIICTGCRIGTYSVLSPETYIKPNTFINPLTYVK